MFYSYSLKNRCGATNKFLGSLVNYERTVTPYYDFKLNKFIRFLYAIKNPHQRLSNVILIAGTKGKGSTATFIESELRANGLKTGLYTSPHILSLRERIKVNGKEISQKALSRIVNKLKPQIKKYNITFFEAMTAIAFIYFLEQKIDYTVLEVGIGGRLDATNVVSPKVSVITKIGYDHTEILGNTLRKIAREKAGIIHPGSFVILSPQRPTAHQIIKKKIRATGTKYYDTKREFQIINVNSDLTGSEFTLKDKNGIKRKFRVSLIGKHQIENACTAIAVLRYLKHEDARISENGIELGIANAQLPARCQIVSKSPLIIVDGAHNPESAKSLYDVIKSIIKEKAIFIFGASRGKLVKEMFRVLSPIAKIFILTQSKNLRSVPSKELAMILKKYPVSFTISENINDALDYGLVLQKTSTPLIITGSFYLAGEALVSLNKLGY